MQNKVLITGGTGLLGKALIEKNDDGDEIMATYTGNYVAESHGQVKYLMLDIRDKSGYESLFNDFRPNVVIHTASIGSPDFAHNNRGITLEVNVNGVKNILSLCERYNSTLIHISSNGIYDGENAPYSEDDHAEPKNYYGQTKLQGEEVVKKTEIPFAIVRPILMYGWNHSFERQNIVTIALSKLIKNEKVFVYDDVYSNPLFSGSCANAIWKMINSNQYGIFNLAGRERVSIYELVVAVAEIFNLNKELVIPVKQGYFNELVPRPKDTSYNTAKMEKILKIKPLTLFEGLEKMRSTQK
ncbi:hypothetical protein A3J90_06955 [candidate division WOR-1 bacterium RIFOXYC2_FULL_37_10]|uniref:dTDP-4-dehydrorhamnose reductase n=1 Tax=candidate division WOR-1 bacterium RIFOXYB2_FULL_37_13 TaxID=1802579 RepID=A0A1F4SQ75_UNCSA|nr:MAG: hypothetical protein A2310_07520 [candidate division WOR-1 bacterium RIFOXYB2_FULL_37_13]OGC34222.1 MAG: hypothetical protein A3J90_06955 [candidate division WOR-1 bacterium RIFOXYC2_FULL_37_10]